MFQSFLLINIERLPTNCTLKICDKCDKLQLHEVQIRCATCSSHTEDLRFKEAENDGKSM